MRSRQLTSIMLASAALTFLLPFGTVLQGTKQVSFRGVELATATIDADSGNRALVEEFEEDSGAFALVTFAAAVVGAVVAASRDRGGGYVVGGLIGLFLLWWQSYFVLAVFDVRPVADYGPAFVVTVLLFAAGGVTRLVSRLRQHPRGRRGTFSSK